MSSEAQSPSTTQANTTNVVVLTPLLDLLWPL